MMMAFIISCRPRLDCLRAWDDDRLDQDSGGGEGHFALVSEFMRSG